jgi:hypothetical protein
LNFDVDAASGGRPGIKRRHQLHLLLTRKHLLLTLRASFLLSLNATS